MDGTVVGKVTKQWSGVAREAFTDADNFGVNFPMDLDVRIKTVLLAAVFLIVSVLLNISKKENFHFFFEISKTKISFENCVLQDLNIFEKDDEENVCCKLFPTKLCVHALPFLFLITVLVITICAFLYNWSDDYDDVLRGDIKPHF